MRSEEEIGLKTIIFHLREYYTLVRFEHAVMLAVAVLIAEIITLGTFPSIELVFFLSLTVPIFAEMGSFGLNDYMDVETDRINGMQMRPLVKGTISPKNALYFSMFCFMVSIVSGFFINTSAFLIALFFSAFAIAYNWKLKDLPLLGNIFIGTTMAIPFIFGGYVYSGSPPGVIWDIAVLGFIAGVAREIVKSVEDIKGDVEIRSSKTLPTIIGKGPSVFVASMLFLLFIPLTIVPFTNELTLAFASGFFLFIADFSILVLSLYLLYARRDKSFSIIRKYSLGALFCGLLSLLLASVGL